MAYEYKLVINEYTPTGTLTAMIASTPSAAGTSQAITYATEGTTTFVSIASIATGESFFVKIYDDEVFVIADTITPGENQYPLATETEQLSLTVPAGQPTTVSELFGLLNQLKFGKAVMTNTGGGAATLEVYDAAGTTVVATQALTDDGTAQTQNIAT